MRRHFLLFLFAALAFAADVFVYPPPANSIPDDSNQLPRFTVGTTVTLRWSSSLSIISIGLRTKGDKILLLGGAAQGNILEQQPNRNTTSWKVQSIGTTEIDGIYYFAGISADQSSYFTSNYFIIESAGSAKTSSTTSSSSSTALSTSSISFSSTTSSSAFLSTPSTPSGGNPPVSQTADSGAANPTTKLPGPSAASKTGLSTGAKVALGVAIPLGIIAILAGAFFLYRRGVKKGQMAAAKKTEAGLPLSPESYQPYRDPAQYNGYYEPQKDFMPPVEIGGNESGPVTHELPTDQQRRYQLG